MIKPYYQDEAVTIYHGDNREILQSLPKADLCLTDPPFGIGFASQPTTGQRRRGMIPINWDDEPGNIDALLNSAEFLIIWGGNYFKLPISKSWLCWFKPDAPPSMGNFELAWTNIGHNTRLFRKSISSTNPERVGHPTQKPVDLMRWCLSFASDAQKVVDPFMGSGTVLRAAKDIGIKAVGIEIEESYCETAARRMAQEVLAL